MRRIVPIVLLALLSACNAGGSTGPSTGITVMVRDDRGFAAGRHQLVVTPTASSPMSAATRSDGKAEIAVSDAGTYQVKVIPRAGFYAGIDALSKTVTVSANSRSVVVFTLYRAGVSDQDQPCALDYGSCTDRNPR